MKKTFCALLVLLITIAFAMQIYAKENQPLQGRVIILDPGHGLGADNVFAGYSEQRRMLLLARKIQAELEARGATVLLTRETEANVSLPVRPALMNRWSLEALRAVRMAEGAAQAEIDELDRLLHITKKVIVDPETYAPIYMNMPFCAYYRRIHPDWRRIFEKQSDPFIRNNFLMISLHSNAVPGPPFDTSANGADIFISTNCNPRNRYYFANYSHADITYLFADMLLDGINAVGIRRNNIIPHHWMVIRETNLPAVLVENGFHTNAGDRARLMDNAFLSRLAGVYADTIERYFAIIAPYAPFVTDAVVADAPIHTPIELRAGSVIDLIEDMRLYTNVGDENHVAMLGSQPVWIIEVYGNWVRIGTWLGPKWVNFG